MSEKQAEEMVLSAQVDRAVGVVFPGRLAGVAAVPAAARLGVEVEPAVEELVVEGMELEVGVERVIVLVVEDEEVKFVVCGARFLAAPLGDLVNGSTFNLPGSGVLGTLGPLGGGGGGVGCRGKHLHCNKDSRPVSSASRLWQVYKDGITRPPSYQSSGGATTKQANH